MKKTVLFIALIALALASCSKLEQNEKKFLKGLTSEDYEESVKAFNEFCSWLEHDKSTITHPFNLMREKMDMTIATSGDGNLRIYSWPSGGTDSVTIYANVSQWKVGENFVGYHGPIDKLLAGRSADVKKKGSATHRIDTIIDIQLPDKTVYLISQSYVNTRGMRRAYVSASYIEGVVLRLLPFFFDGVEIAGNNEFNDQANTPISTLFKWDEKAKRFYAYQTDDNNNLIPGKYTVYELGNNQFTRLPNE